MKTSFHIHSAHYSDIVADPAVGQPGRNPAPHHHYKITTNEAFAARSDSIKEIHLS